MECSRLAFGAGCVCVSGFRSRCALSEPAPTSLDCFRTVLRKYCRMASLPSLLSKRIPRWALPSIPAIAVVPDDATYEGVSCSLRANDSRLQR